MSAPSEIVHSSVFQQFYALTKPRVIQLIVFCALIGMVLAVPGLPSWPQVQLALVACLGIWLVAGAAAAFNLLNKLGARPTYSSPSSCCLKRVDETS